MGEFEQDKENWTTLTNCFTSENNKRNHSCEAVITRSDQNNFDLKFLPNCFVYAVIELNRETKQWTSAVELQLSVQKILWTFTELNCAF